MLCLNNVTIESRTSDQFINATQMCRAGGKRFKDWARLASTKELIDALQKNLTTGNPGTRVTTVETVCGRYGGSWIHPYLAVPLAQWISPTFSIAVSCWVNQWRNYSEINEKEFQRELSELKPSTISQKEKEIQLKLQIELDADVEFKTPSGYIDIITDDRIIEIKEYCKWKHAIGQIICYGIHHPQKQKKIILFGSGNIDEIICNACNKLGIEVQFIE